MIDVPSDERAFREFARDLFVSPIAPREGILFDNEDKVAWMVRLLLDLDQERERLAVICEARDRDLLYHLQYLATRFNGALRSWLDRELAKPNVRKARHVKTFAGAIGFRVVDPATAREVLYVKGPKSSKELNLSALIVPGIPPAPTRETAQP